MKTKLSGAIVVLLLVLTRFSFAQDSSQVKPANLPQAKTYKLAMGFQLTGLGLAFINPKGLTVKHFITEHSALEYVITPGGRNILGISVLWQRHFPIPDSPRLLWFAGAGTNLDIYRYQPITNATDPVKERVITTTTLLGTLGAEYAFPKAPFTLTFDIKSGILVLVGSGQPTAITRFMACGPVYHFGIPLAVNLPPSKLKKEMYNLIKDV